MKKIYSCLKQRKRMFFSAITLFLINFLFFSNIAKAQSDAGSYTIKWYAADPEVNKAPYLPTYQKLAPSLLACAVSNGRASNPLPNAVAYAAPPVSSNLDAVTSLAPKNMALCQVVPFFLEIDVNGPTSPGIININPEWLAKTTSGDDFGFDPNYGVYCAFVDYGEVSNIDPGNNARVDSYTSSTLDVGGQNERIRGTIQVSGLDNGDKVIVEVWVVLKCSIPLGSSGNVQTALIDAQTGAVGDAGESINTGNQTVPLLKVQEFFSAKADISVTKSANNVCFGDNITYTIVVTNNETSTVANGIVATDVLGANQTFVSASGASTSQTGQTTIFNVGSLSPQESKTLTVVAKPTSTGSITNQVDVTEITDDPNPNNNGASAAVTVYELPTCSITGGVETINTGGSTNWCATEGMISYAWTGPNGFTSDRQCVDVSDAGEYSVTITNANGCSSTCTRTLNVNACQLTVSVNSEKICNGESTTLTATDNGSNSTYLWSTGETTKSITVSPTATTDYTVTVTDGACSVSGTQGTVTVNDKPAKPTITGGPTSFCTGSSVELTSSSAVGNQWYRNGVLIADATSQTYTATTGGTYSVVVTNDAGCSATSDDIVVKVNDLPAKPTITCGATSFCTGGSTVLSSSSATGNQWYKDGVIITGATNQTYTATAAGLYTVKVTNDAGCSATSEGTIVTVNPAPSCTISNTTSAGSHTTILGAPVNFTGPTAPGGSTYGYSWSFSSNTSGATFAGGTTTATTQSVTVTTSTTGSYTLSLTVTDKTYSTNCPATCTYSITTNAAGPYYTVTQGFYGNVGGKVTVPSASCSTYVAGTKGNVDGLIAISIKRMPESLLKLGIPANNKTFTMGATATEDKNLVTYLPAGQAAAVIAANAGTNNNTNITTNLPKLFNKKISSILLGQTITLKLNVYIPGNTLGSFVLKTDFLTTQKADLSKCPTIKLVACSTDASAISSLQLTTSAGLKAWINTGTKTVLDLLNLDSAVLGGGTLPQGVTLADLSNATDVINRSFDGGRYFLGYFQTAKSCSTPPAARSSIVQADVTVTELTVAAYPNPFTDRVKFTLTSPVSGKASLDVYNMLGQKVGNAYQGYLNAGKGQVIDYKVPAGAGSLIYTLTVGDKRVNGKLLKL